MNSSQLVTRSLLHALGALAYVSGVASVMFNAERIFGEKPGIAGVIAFLLLFILSAAVTGALVIAKPVMLYLNGQKTEALKLISYTIGWLALFTIVILLIVGFK